MANARFLAHDIEEDDDYKSELYIWALGFRWMQHYRELHTSRNVLWRVMDYRGIVSRACCEKVCPKQFIYISQCISPNLTA
jgi:hypothetical protein